MKTQKSNSRKPAVKAAAPRVEYLSRRESAEIISRLWKESREKPARLVYQFDVDGDPDPTQGRFYADQLWELRRGASPVRVQIMVGTSEAEAMVALQRVMRCLNETPLSEFGDQSGPRTTKLPAYMAEIEDEVPF